MIRNEPEYQQASARLADERKRLADHRERLKQAGLSDEEIKRVRPDLKRQRHPKLRPAAHRIEWRL